MKYITLIYCLAIAAYNLLADNSMVYWRFHFYFFIHITLMVAFWTLAKHEVRRQVRNIYKLGFVFSVFYALFQVTTLFSKTVYDYLGYINSYLWSIIMFGVVLIGFNLLLYDERK